MTGMQKLCEKWARQAGFIFSRFDSYCDKDKLSAICAIA